MKEIVFPHTQRGNYNIRLTSVGHWPGCYIWRMGWQWQPLSKKGLGYNPQASWGLSVWMFSSCLHGFLLDALACSHSQKGEVKWSFFFNCPVVNVSVNGCLYLSKCKAIISSGWIVWKLKDLGVWSDKEVILPVAFYSSLREARGSVDAFLDFLS